MDNETLTVQEMEVRFSGEWVLADIVDVNEQGYMLSGRIVAHGLDRNAVYEAGFEVSPRRHLATRCFIKPEKGEAVAL